MLDSIDGTDLTSRTPVGRNRAPEAQRPYKLLRMPGPSAVAMATICTWIALVIVIVGAGRSMMTEDDGWAYARTVEHLLSTGRYQLDSWAAANMPVQIYLAAGASLVFGYSFGLLQACTLALLFVAILSLYLLIREIGGSSHMAAVLAIAPLAAPGVLPLAVSFMSDVQFLGWMVLALWLYVRAIRRRSDATLFAASLAAALAIGTRQFGIAMLVGCIAVWCMPRASGGFRIRQLVLATAAPAAMAWLQLSSGLGAPTFTQAVRLAEQAMFVSQAPSGLIQEVLWRIAMVLRYLGVLLLPVAPLLLALAVPLLRADRLWRLSHLPARLPLAVLLGCSVLLIYTALAGSEWTARTPAAHERLPATLSMPLHWLLPHMLRRYESVQATLALWSFAAAVLLCLIPLRWPVGRRLLAAITPEQIFLAATALGFVLLHFVYVQFNDTYLVALLPFGLVLLAYGALRFPLPRATWTATLLLVGIMTIGWSLWLRGDLNRQEAAWHAADRLLAAGVSRDRIGAGLHWAEYHGGFDRWLYETGWAAAFAQSPAAVPRDGDLHGPFYRWWWRQHFHCSDYWIIELQKSAAPAGWKIVETLTWRNWTFSPRTMATLKRTAESPSDCRAVTP